MLEKIERLCPRLKKHPPPNVRYSKTTMPLLDCDALLKESKTSKMKVLAEAFVKHVIPMIDGSRVQEAFVQQIKVTSKPELVLFSYKTTEITVDGNEAAEDSLSGQTVASMAYEFCDKLPCGTPIGKAMSGFAACELLGMILGPNIHVKTRFKSRGEDHPQWLGYTSEIVASFQEKPVKRSASGLAWWPETFLKELITSTAGATTQQFERSSESLLNALLATDASPESNSEDVVWTRDADGVMRCPGNGMDLRDPRTNALWQCGLASDAPKEQTVPGGARRFFSIERDRRAVLRCSRPDPILDFKHNSRTQKLPHGTYLDERDDQKCTYCGQMESDCGGDHGDDMRYDNQIYGSHDSDHRRSY